VTGHHPHSEHALEGTLRGPPEGHYQASVSWQGDQVAPPVLRHMRVMGSKGSPLTFFLNALKMSPLVIPQSP
jgi:hypothetical protein